jgi:hypothetical protein
MVYSMVPKTLQVLRLHFNFFALCIFFYTNAGNAQAQQPFVTDDTDVTSRRRFHLELSNQFDILQRSAFPSLKQNTTKLALDYGLVENLEISIQSPLITILNARGTGPRLVSGIGDTSLSMKYNFYRESANSSLPALSASLSMELPTGDSARQLGTGLYDYYLNMIMQKSLTDSTTVRVNGGILFTGIEAADATGMKTRGRVVTIGTSITKNLSEKMTLGGELTGAVSGNSQLDRGQLQIQIGGNYAINKKCSFDFGLIAGRYPASPRIGGQLGLSIDFE